MNLFIFLLGATQLVFAEYTIIPCVQDCIETAGPRVGCNDGDQEVFICVCNNPSYDTAFGLVTQCMDQNNCRPNDNYDWKVIYDEHCRALYNSYTKTSEEGTLSTVSLPREVYFSPPGRHAASTGHEADTTITTKTIGATSSMHPTTSVTLGQIIQTSVSSLSPRPTPLSSPGSRKHDGVSSVSPTPTLLSSPGSRKDDGESSVSPTPNLLPSPGSRNDDSMSMVAMAVLYAVIGLAVILIVLVVIWFYMQRRGLRRGLREELPDGGQAMTQEQKGPGPGPDPVVPGYCELATSEVTPIELEAIVAYELDSSTQPEHMNGTGLQNIPRESNPRPRQTNGSLEFELPGTVPGMLPNAFSRST